jgi:peptidoglycan/xylan/chitin deacetylase (PgdA/CDA1 family)
MPREQRRELSRVTPSLARLLAEREREGRRDARAWHREYGLLATLPLARFEDTSVRGVLLRKLLLASHVPAHWLVPLRGLAGARRTEFARFLSTLAYWQGVRRSAGPTLWSRLMHPPVILMYHAIGAGGEQRSRYILPQRVFDHHMRWVKCLKRSVISLHDFVETRRAGRLPPPRAVVITFDDGYRDNVDLALPVLAQFNFAATVFVVTAHAGAANTWDAAGELAGRPLLSWDEMCSAQGRLDFDGHSRAHPELPTLDDPRLADEVSGVRQDLDRELGARPRTFAYPHGRFDARTQAAVEAAGFRAACCSLGGTNEPWVPLYELRRVEIKGTDGLPTFLLAVLLGMRITPRQLLSKLLHGG